MKSNNAQAVVKKDDLPQMPAFMKGHSGRGTEDWTASDYAMPRVKLLQGISPELQAYDDVKSGDFFHTTVERSLGDKLVMVPLHFSRRYVLWRPRPPIDQGGLLARADDSIHWDPPNVEFKVKIDRRGTETVWRTAETVEKSGLHRWGTYDSNDPQSGPAATESIVVVMALPDYPELSPVALFLQRGSMNVAKNLRGKLKFSSAPIYGTRFMMTSVVDTSPSGQYNNFQFTANGFVSDEEEFKSYERMYESFKATGVKVHDLEGAQDEGAAGGGTGDAKEAAEKERSF